MRINEEIRKDIAIFSVTDELIGQLESKEINKHIDTILVDGIKKFVIDLTEVKWLSSSSLGILVASRNKIAQHGGKLRLVGATKNVQNLLTITQLMQFFELPDTVHEAIESF